MHASTQYMEHRWGTRIELNAPAELWTAEGVTSEACVRNASLSGAFVETTARVPLLSRIALRPLARNGDWLDACVVRVEPAGLALEWLDPGLHSVTALLALRPDAAVAAPVAAGRAARLDVVVAFPERTQVPLER
jgi:hypothetical protein